MIPCWAMILFLWLVRSVNCALPITRPSQPDFSPFNGDRKYGIINCEDVNIKAISSVLSHLNWWLSVALDRKRDTETSKPEYALFKDRPTLESVWDLILQAQNRVPKKGLLPFPDQPSQPLFICVTSDMSWQWSHCTDSSRSIPPLGFHSPGTRNINLCPSFWRLPPPPATAAEFGEQNCPRVGGNQFVLDTGDEIQTWRKHVENQAMVLLHEIIHFYLGDSSLGAKTDPVEVYEANDCIALNAANSARNPMNYQLYVASTYTYFLLGKPGFSCWIALTVTTVLLNGCTEAPDPRAPPFLPPTDGTGQQSLVDLFDEGFTNFEPDDRSIPPLDPPPAGNSEPPFWETLTAL